MKVAFVTLSLMSFYIAGSIAGPLVYPQQNTQEDLQTLSERIMEELRQEEGSERQVYHVYLPDGRLQRVQYTSAPIRHHPARRATEEQESQYSGLRSLGATNTYYVQVPASRIQELRSQEGVTKEQLSRFTAEASSRPEIDSQFVPLRIVTPEQLSQIRSLLK